jgi:hypothetical protein
MIENVISMYLMSPRYYEGKRKDNSIAQTSITIVHDHERLFFTQLRFNESNHIWETYLVPTLCSLSKPPVESNW